MTRKGYELYRVLEAIDDDLIVKAGEANPFKKKITWSKWAAAAACAAVITIAGLLFPGVISLATWNEKAPLMRGEHYVALERCNLQKNGIKGVVDILRQYVYMPEKMNMIYFSAEISPKGVIEEFELYMHGFDRSNVYWGAYSFKYNYADQQMVFTRPDFLKTAAKAASTQIIYNENDDINYLSEQQRKLPLERQMKLLGFDRYVVQFRSQAQLEAGKPVIDGSQGTEIPVLTMEEYRNGLGGASSGEVALYITLSDGVNSIDPHSLFLTASDGVSVIGPNVIAYEVTPVNP